MFIVGLALLDVGRAELEHAVEQSREFVRSGIDGRWCAHSGSESTDKGSNGSLALHGSLGSQAEHPRSAILGFSRPGAQNLTSADAVIRTDFEPGTEVLFAFPTVHV